jgi:hypothetical protein
MTIAPHPVAKGCLFPIPKKESKAKLDRQAAKHSLHQLLRKKEKETHWPEVPQVSPTKYHVKNYSCINAGKKVRMQDNVLVGYSHLSLKE